MRSGKGSVLRVLHWPVSFVSQFQVSLVADVPTQHQVCFIGPDQVFFFTKYQICVVADAPTQPPIPSSSAYAIWFFCPISAGSLRLFGSSFAVFTQQLGFALGFQVSSSALVCRAPGLHLSLSTLGSTLAPHSLCSTVIHHPSGSTLVSHHPGYATDIRSSSYASSHHLFASTGSSFPPDLQLS